MAHTLTPPKLLEQVQARLRVKHYSIRTERTYLDWTRRYILFHQKKHPAKMGAPEVEAFLLRLAVEGNVAASTQNQAKSALLFLYREVLGIDLPWLDNVTKARVPQRLPVVLTQAEVRMLLDRLEGGAQEFFPILIMPQQWCDSPALATAPARDTCALFQAHKSCLKQGTKRK